VDLARLRGLYFVASLGTVAVIGDNLLLCLHKAGVFEPKSAVFEGIFINNGSHGFQGKSSDFKRAQKHRNQRKTDFLNRKPERLNQRSHCLHFFGGPQLRRLRTFQSKKQKPL
jgi:hypothetical protein